MIEKITELQKTHSVSDATLCKECELNHSAPYHWRKGVAKPTTDALIKIADYFNVSIDYLCGRSTTPIHKSDYLPPEIQELLDICKMIPPHKKLDNLIRQAKVIAGVENTTQADIINATDTVIKQ